MTAADREAAHKRAEQTRTLDTITEDDNEDTRQDLNLAAAFLELEAELSAEKQARIEAERQAKDWMQREQTARNDKAIIAKDYKQVCNWLVCCADEMNLRTKEYRRKMS